MNYFDFVVNFQRYLWTPSSDKDYNEKISKLLCFLTTFAMYWLPDVKYHLTSKNEYRIDCHWSILLYAFRGDTPWFFNRKVSIPSRYFLCVHLCSFPTILASSQLIPWGHIAACFASPPSPSFILLPALSRFPLLISSLVSLTLSWCSFSLDSHLRSVSPVYDSKRWKRVRIQRFMTHHHHGHP